ncbi:tRNA-dihydrouridine(16/17) synthase [NAD(P)(+)]-like protein [Kappamyces sp. JEL0680]|nr:tRNA-dihydrouridine(16/17) synthase [NAD(P)(+)]-like protein [Kappamyces sp. JEL0680]
MIEEAGAAMLTVHGRLREQKGVLTGLADWNKIRAVREALTIPVIANGNILYFQDIARCLEATGVAGIMSAESNLCNPALFEDKLWASWHLVQEYLDIIKEHPDSATAGQAKAHLFKMYHAPLMEHTDLRDKLGRVNGWSQIHEVHFEMKARLINEYGDAALYKGPVVFDASGIMQLPIWVAQPKVRKHAPPVSKATSVAAPEPIAHMPESKAKLAKAASTGKAEPAGKRKREGQESRGAGRPDSLTPGKKKQCGSCRNVASEKCLEKLCKSCCTLPKCPSHSRVFKMAQRKQRDRPSMCLLL